MSVAVSTVEVEYIAACSACSEAMWHQKIPSKLFDLELDVTCIFCDNQSCIKLSQKLAFHDKSKHINTKYHYNRDMVEKGVVKLQYVAIDE